MRSFRIVLAILLGLSLGLGPAWAGIGKPAAAPKHDCMGKAKGSCPCDDGPAPCKAASCKIACGSIFGLTASVDPALPRPLATTVGPAEPVLRSVRTWSDPPIPRS